MIVTIRLEGMEFRAFHGCYELEKVVGNKFVVDMAIEAEIGNAAQRDDITQTVSYLTVYEMVSQEMETTSDIIEHVAYRISSAIKAHFDKILSIETTVYKIAPPLGGKVERVSATIKL